MSRLSRRLLSEFNRGLKMGITGWEGAKAPKPIRARTELGSPCSQCKPTFHEGRATCWQQPSALFNGATLIEPCPGAEISELAPGHVRSDERRISMDRRTRNLAVEFGEPIGLGVGVEEGASPIEGLGA